MEDPAGVTRRICGSAGLDPVFYNHYVFDIHNASRRVRWPKIHSTYRSLIWRIKPHVHDKPVVRATLRGLRRSADTLLGRSGNEMPGGDPGDVLTGEDRRRLEDYYRNEPAELARLLRLVDWVW